MATGDIGLVAGLFSVKYRYDECISYSDLGFNDELSTSTRAAQAFGVMAVIFAAPQLVIAWLFLVFRLPPRLWKILVVLAACSMVSQSFTFLIFIQANEAICNAGDTQCQLGISSIFSITAIVLFFLIGIIAWFTKAPEDPILRFPFLSRILGRFFEKAGFKKKRFKGFSSIKCSHLAMIVMSFIITCLSFGVFLDCRFYKIDWDDIDRHDYLGLFRYEYSPTDSCLYFEEGDRVSKSYNTTAAQVFGVMAAVFGGVLVVALLVMIFVEFPAWWRKNMFIWALLCSLWQSLTFLMAIELNDTICADQASCGISTDGIISICAAVLYFGLGVFAFVKRADFEPEDESDMEEVSPEKIDSLDQVEEAPMEEEAAVEQVEVGGGVLEETEEVDGKVHSA